MYLLTSFIKSFIFFIFMKYSVIGLSIPKELVARIDEERGMIARSRYVSHLLKQMLEEKKLGSVKSGEDYQNQGEANSIDR
jgi:hypothetical protein